MQRLLTRNEYAIERGDYLISPGRYEDADGEELEHKRGQRTLIPESASQSRNVRSLPAERIQRSSGETGSG